MSSSKVEFDIETTNNSGKKTWSKAMPSSGVKTNSYQCKKKSSKKIAFTAKEISKTNETSEVKTDTSYYS